MRTAQSQSHIPAILGRTAERFSARRLTESLRRSRWIIAVSAVPLLVLLPYFAAGDPPGVDAPTFLHFAWVFEQSLTGSGSSFLEDRWWYGGLPYLQAYSPGGYGAVGLLAAITPLDLASAFKLVMALGLVGTAVTTYLLGRTLGIASPYSFLAGALVALSYPVIAGIGIFGWLPTLASMPFAIAAYIYVERWAVTQDRRKALIAGALLGAALLVHHMTAIAVGMAILARLAVFAMDTPGGWRLSARAVLAIGLGGVLASAWWAVPFLANTVSVGFQRELAGNWQFGVSTFVSAAFERGRIGVETYPSYLGIAQAALGIGGVIYAVVYRTRLRGLAVAAAILFWFSMGASANPLIRVYPLSGLDVSRFAFYVAPLLAVAGAAMVQDAVKARVRFRSPLVLFAVIAAVLVLPVADVLAAREVLEPVGEPPEVTRSIDWIAENVPPDSKVLAVGYRNWDGYWIPQRAGVPIMDGWYDEGAENWSNVRKYRVMGWLSAVDADSLHEVMTLESTDYLVVTDWDTTDSPGLFRAAVAERPDLFAEVAAFDDTVVYRRR